MIIKVSKPEIYGLEHCFYGIKYKETFYKGETTTCKDVFFYSKLYDTKKECQQVANKHYKELKYMTKEEKG